MGKGELTKQAILDEAINMAAVFGLEGLSIGKLAEKLSLSRSGLFSHFRSKEALQIQILDNAARVFTDNVIRPALQAPRGSPRVQSLFENWLQWLKKDRTIGGCIFMTAAVELDDKEGPVRDRLVAIQKEWFKTRARVVSSGVSEGEFKKDLDCDQFAHDLNSIMLGYHYSDRLLNDSKAEERARKAFRVQLQQAKKSKN